MSGSKFKVGDRVRTRNGKQGTVNYIPTSFYGRVHMLPDGQLGEHQAESYADHELELIPKFDFTIGDKLTTTGWAHTPERWVQVEWIGPASFAGETHDGKKVVHDFASANSNWQKWMPVHPFKVGDKVRNSNDRYSWPAEVVACGFGLNGTPVVKCQLPNDPEVCWTGSPASLWEHYVEPSPVEKPVVKKWLVTTEEGKPKKGDVFVDSHQHRLSISRLDFIHTTTNVITSVQPLTNLNDWIVGGDGK